MQATFAEIPGVLETGTIRKIDRRYPFNDACQWFIDHADLIILVYDYAKLDIGPETEALLDQLKGRESQVSPPQNCQEVFVTLRNWLVILILETDACFNKVLELFI